MNMQGHLSGQISGQVPNQAGNQFHGLTQQNDSSLSNRMHTLGGANRNTMNLESEVSIARRFVQQKIKDFIMMRQQNSPNLSEQRVIDIVRRIDETLWRSATSKEEYINLETLEKRLHAFISSLPSSGQHNQQYQQQRVNNSSSSAIGTMIPTPGMPATSGGTLPRGYQQSPANNFSVANSVPSAGVPRMTGQMIPTPGFNSNNNNNNNNNNNSSSNNNNNIPSLVNANSTPGSFSSTVESSAMLTQPAIQKQHINSGQTSRMLHNIGSHISAGGSVRSDLQQQKSYGFTTNGGAFHESLGSNITQNNNMQLLNSSGTSSDNYLSAKQFGEATPTLFQQHYNQRPQPMLQGDGYRGIAPESSEPGNFYGHINSSGGGTNNQIRNNQNMKQINVPSMTRANSGMVVNGSNLHASHQALDILPPIEQSESMSYQQALNSSQDNFSSHSQQQSQQQQPYHLSQQFYQQQRHPKQRIQPSQDISMNQNSQHVQQLVHSQQQQIVVDSQNDFISSNGMQSNPNNWDTKFSHEENLQEDFCQGISGQDLAHRNNVSFDGDFRPTDIINATTTEPTNTITDPIREQQYKNQRRWILLLLHARRCMAPEGSCREVNCVKVQQLLKHMNVCTASQCKFPRCQTTKVLVKHRMHCRDTQCPVCIPVKDFIEKHLKARARFDSNNPPGIIATSSSFNTDTGSKVTPKATTPQVDESVEDLQTSLKRIKMEQSFQHLVPNEGEGLSISVPPIIGQSHVSITAPPQEYRNNDSCSSSTPRMKPPEIIEVKRENSSVRGNAITTDTKKENMDGALNYKPPPAKEPIVLDVTAPSNVKQEYTKSEKEADLSSKTESSTENATGTKSGKPNIKGVSLTELFTPEQVREHIRGLRQWVGQSKAKAEKNQAMEHSMSENSCQLCAVEKLTFEPPPIYCSPCGARIKRNAMYYTTRAGDTQHYFCIPCYNESRGDSILVDGSAMSKAKMEKKKNDEETEEWWVQCDKCEAWQHQICALFNGRRNDGGQADYTCPNCYIIEVERGERKPLPQSAVLGAKDLPRTILSDHIEQRLFKRLKQERQDRARLQGKSYDEVPGVEALVVRVVSSVDKKLEVKQRFLDIFQEENYPTEFPYKSKVVLLFQRSEGVEVCLFAMYVQEFGSECQEPNHRRVYLSYLDSVKYFRPEIRTVTGEALRTFVYHEILIGYLDYCKKRGFTSCYIWACPPLKGEDYILYCHPEIQKTPKSDKLREWYLSMLRKASKESIVVELTNLYDHFFVSTGECKAKVTAARLPYFDGDYWPGAAEDMIYQIQQEEDGRKQFKKGTIKKPITKRALKACGQYDLSGNASKDLLLMHKLGETISPMKEDFIMVHLQHACSHCCLLMVFGNRWVCKQCKNFQLCDKCYESEQKLEDREKHPVNQRDKHLFYPVLIGDVPEDTKDKDEILESEFFDTRQAFLSLCQGNHYQYDTLRRAKHSSMMVLYHLHNPTAPAFVITCCVCHLDIEAGQGWRCETCPDYDVCNSCYKKDGGVDHPHELTNHPSMADRNAQNKEARQQRVLQLRKMLELLVHASQCRSTNCQYLNCRKVKGLFRHGMQCRTRASGGCVLCKKMWELLQLHARTCKESQCFVPRCRDLKEHMRRLTQQADSRRRAAVMEMMRQRAAEVAGTSG